MRYVLEPLNESQEMDCRVEFSGTRAAVAKKAVNIAATLQGCLDGSTISCRVAAADGTGVPFVALPDGALVDANTGDVIRVES